MDPKHFLRHCYALQRHAARRCTCLSPSRLPWPGPPLARDVPLSSRFLCFTACGFPPKARPWQLGLS